jgi:hypothetical protein
MKVHTTGMRPASYAPKRFCWTRFGTEAGESIAEIVQRKELERSRNGGVFLWGIGNSVASGISELVRTTDVPEVLFSPIKSAPRPVDIAPERYVAWTRGETADGCPYDLPPNSIVISGHTRSASRHWRYALVCRSESPLLFDEGAHSVNFAALRNLISNKPLGPSQVTAVVKRVEAVDGGGSEYAVAFRAELASPYFVRLRDPVPVLLGRAIETLSRDEVALEREEWRAYFLATRSQASA